MRQTKRKVHLPSEFVESGCYLCKVTDKFPVTIGKAKKAAKLFKVGRTREVTTCPDFVGIWRRPLWKRHVPES